MIHKAFREILGETATQMGSENSPGRLRFDFPNPAPVPASPTTSRPHTSVRIAVLGRGHQVALMRRRI